MSKKIKYHTPKNYGTCDGCDQSFKRATHKMPNGDDLCGYCYGVEMDYIQTPTTDEDGTGGDV